MNKIIRATEVEAGMELVEADGYLLTVTAVIDRGGSLLILCRSMTGEPSVTVCKDSWVRVAA